MADISDRRIPYEILIRFGEDGQVKGAHLVNRRIVEIDGERMKDEIGEALPISLVEANDRPVLQQVLGEALETALATVERQRASLERP